MDTKRTLILLALLIGGGSGFAQTDRITIKKGNDAFEDGDFEAAKSAYNEVSNKSNLKDVAGYNQGTAAYKEGDFAGAVKHFDKVSMETNDKILKSDAEFNKGNSLAQMQDYEGATEAYKNALRANPESLKARNNLKWVMDEERRQQQKQEGGDGQEGEGQPQDGSQQDGGEGSGQEGEQSQSEGEGDEGSEDGESGDQNSEGDDSQGGDPQDESNNEGASDGEEDSQSSPSGGSTNSQEKLDMVPDAKMSQEEAEKYLNAIENSEKQIQGKMRGRMLNGKGKSNSKHIAKDW